MRSAPKAGAAITGALTVWLIRFLLLNRKRPVYPAPQSLIIQPQVEGSVNRRPDELELIWTRTAQVIRIFASLDPDLADLDPLRQTPLMTVQQTQHTMITSLDKARRWYFGLYFDADPTPLILAERFLPFEGGFNVRDLGGYQSQNGKRLRWGQVFRSAHLSHLTQADLNLIDQLGLKLICDLRSTPEVNEYPNVLPEGVPARRIPILSDHAKAFSPRVILLNFRRLDALMTRSYTQTMLMGKAQAFGHMIRLIADPAQRPILFHCTAGKDRTGLTAALILSVLGVPDETIIADYSLTNLSYEPIYQMINENAGRLRVLHLTVDDLQPLLIADPDYIRSALNYLRKRCGSVEAYLTGPAGLELSVIESLRQGLLS